MKIHKFILLVILLPQLLFAESSDYYLLSSKNLKQFDKSIHDRFQGQTVYSLRDIKTGKQISAVLGEKLVKPASVQKLVTTYAALRELGGEFKFHTDFIYLEKPQKTLLVKGYGDPTMTDERLYKSVDDLYRAGIRRIENLKIDPSSFSDPISRTGINPYQAAQSAINFNFNTINVRGQLVDGRKLFSATSFSPIQFNPTVIIGEIPGVSFSREGEKVDLRLTKESKLVEDNYSVDNPVEYFAQALAGILRLRGIEAPNVYVVDEAEEEIDPVVISNSEELTGILADMNRYSSNFLAGQITYQLGRESSNKFSYQKGLKVLTKYSDRASRFFDGSGLSKENQLTASGLSLLITEAIADQSIAADFQASLSKFGKRGTLRRRELNFPGEEKIWAKTGTIDGVSSIAGTIELKDSRLAAFVIITNGPVSKAESVEREDYILRSFLAGEVSQ